MTVFNTYLKLIPFTKTKFWDVYSLTNKDTVISKFPLVKLKEILTQRKRNIVIDDSKLYQRCRVQIQGKGVILRDEVFGNEIKTKKQQLCKNEDFLVAEIDAKVGGYGIVPSYLENAIVSGHYFLFEIDKTKLLPEFLSLVVRQNEFSKQVKSTGSTNYAAIRPYHVLEYIIPLPSIKEQELIVNSYYQKVQEAEEQQRQADGLSKDISQFLFESLGIFKTEVYKNRTLGLQLIDFKSIQEWGLDKILSNSIKKSAKYQLTCINENPKIAIELLRGKSPKYKENSNAFILNQKCNRWNEIDLKHVKSVDEIWLKSINQNHLTKEGDILINSTGEGTIGRASYINKEHEGLLYDSHLLLLRLDKSIINPELFVEIFNSEYGQNQVNDIKSAQATKQTELGTGNLAKIQFPLPSDLKLQNSIIEKVKTLRNTKAILLEQSANLLKLAEFEFEQTIFG